MFLHKIARSSKQQAAAAASPTAAAPEAAEIGSNLTTPAAIHPKQSKKGQNVKVNTDLSSSQTAAVARERCCQPDHIFGHP
jgi:hypothetical protein